MRKIPFGSDYMQSALPAILNRMNGDVQNAHTGYGSDNITESARNRIRKAIDMPEAAVEFLVGGTQTNSTIISCLLSNYKGVICADCGHIAVHEAGAVEATGHKVITIPHKEGKLDAQDVDNYLTHFYADESYAHMVIPGMVYISTPSELGTIYSLLELKKLKQVCRKWNLLLYIDGARLGYGLMAENNDVNLQDIATLADAFYIGGTKMGALMGEAVVIGNPDLFPDALTQIKRHGALLAKGWLLAIQFDELFQNNLYLEAGSHAIKMAKLLKETLKAKGYEFAVDSPTNQIFPILDSGQLNEWKKLAYFDVNPPMEDGRIMVRLVTSWATLQSDVEQFLEQIP